MQTIKTYSVMCHDSGCDCDTIIEGVNYDQAKAVKEQHGCEGPVVCGIDGEVKTPFESGQYLIETYADSPKPSVILEVQGVELSQGQVWDVVCTNPSPDADDEPIKLDPDLIEEDRRKGQVFLMPQDTLEFYGHISSLLE